MGCWIRPTCRDDHVVKGTKEIDAMIEVEPFGCFGFTGKVRDGGRRPNPVEGRWLRCARFR